MVHTVPMTTRLMEIQKEFQNAECAAATYVGFWNFDSWTEAGKAIDPNY